MWSEFYGIISGHINSEDRKRINAAKAPRSAYTANIVTKNIDKPKMPQCKLTSRTSSLSIFLSSFSFNPKHNFQNIPVWFRACHSSETARLKFVKDLFPYVDSGCSVGLATLDLAAAFDPHHEIEGTLGRLQRYSGFQSSIICHRAVGPHERHF